MGKLFDQLVSLYRIVDFDHEAIGELRLGDVETVALVQSLLGPDPDETGLALLAGDPDKLAQGQILRIQANPPRRSVGILVKDLGGLLNAGRIKEPAAYYVLAERYAKGDSKPAPAIAIYRKVLALIDLLKASAAYLDEQTDELIFIHEGRFSVPVRYSLGDLDTGLDGSVDRLMAMFNADVHRDQKLAILATSVQEMTSGIEPLARFGVLLSRLDEVTKSVIEGYRLFASNFSYEKIKSDIQDAHIEFTGKIHKTFSDIQSQLLGIPIATVIVATQMKHAEGIGGQFWINTGVALGSLIFVILFCLLVKNQWHTLDVIADEIFRREKAIAKDHKVISDMFVKTFRTLHDRLWWQRFILGVVLAVVIVALIATFVVYAYLLYLPPSVSATSA